MKTIYFDIISIKEKIFFDMINLVKVFSVVVVVLSILLVTIQVCETAKRDFKLKNLFRFMDDKRVNKKTKKEIKHLKDFRVHYIDGNNQEKLLTSESRPPHIHTLIPLPLPVHLPIPTHPGDHSHGIHSPASPFPVIHPDHLPYHHDTRFHNHHPEHHHHPEPQHYHHYEPQHHTHEVSGHSTPHFMAEASSPPVRPMAPPIIIHQDFHPLPLPIHSQVDHIEDRIAFPVFELIGDNPLQESRNPVHPNAHSYGDIDIDDSFRTNFDESDKNYRKIHLNDRERNRGVNKSIQTTVRLVNNKKFNTIHDINTNSEKTFDEENSYSRKVVKTNENHKNSDERQQNQSKDNQNKRENDLSPMDNRLDQKIYSEPFPDEQIVNVVEDEWTFKDLDLWLVR